MARNHDPEGLDKTLAAARNEFGAAGAALVSANVGVLGVAALREQAQHGDETAKARLKQLRDAGVDA